MAAEMVKIRSVKQYLREFGYEAIVKEHQDPKLVKEQILDAFEKEVFGQIVFRFHDPAVLSRSPENVDEKTREGLRHILEQTNRKYKRLCIEFSKYRETHSLLMPDELMMRLKDIVALQEHEREDGPVIADDPVDVVPVEVN